jgi:hypothetical protein
VDISICYNIAEIHGRAKGKSDQHHTPVNACPQALTG